MGTTQTPHKTTFADKLETFQAGLTSLFSGKPEDTESDLSKLLTPNFTQRDDDTTRDFAEFVKHMRWLREMVPCVSLTITQFLRDGPQLAEMHDSCTTLADGTILKAETFLFAGVAEDGRLDWIVEAVKQKK